MKNKNTSTASLHYKCTLLSFTLPAFFLTNSLMAQSGKKPTAENPGKYIKVPVGT